MKITGLESIHVDGGWTVISYLKVTTDAGLTGWAEYSGHQAIPGVLAAMAPRVIGKDPRNLNAIDASLYQLQRPAPGSLFQRGSGAILNACLDIKGKALGVPVYELLGGKVRDTTELYWSHCGLFRAGFPSAFEQVIGKPGVRSLDDLKRAGEEVAAAGYSALKTNLIRFEDPTISSMMRGQPAMNLDGRTISALIDQLTALRDGAGPDVRLALDVNFNFKVEGFRQLARACEPFDLMWIEMDMPDAGSLKVVRDSTTTPVASLEMQLGRRNIRPFLDAYAVDVAIIDGQWNGLHETMKMAHMIDAYDVNVAAHCSAGPLGALMSAHFCAAIPNFRIQEHEADVMPWHDALLTEPNQVERAQFVLSDRPGWGANVDEAVARAHPGDNGFSWKRG
ncbi:mandelate racemase/muconate lactonizing enzyme family protein [Sphingomonas sp. G-3-2-10]|uniref:mandelate racemase/muconate lactonizing enzyme family protein n=1 Tax=Sphingomonas sp. G-3-2-10 TaxID=2728838 RepID=UPI00146AEE37|nr:mandelate racemase/muconate lactonizing enzyme family protein [Sphingomonas sp. G-3-2-10]NML08175.1 mandelate racemase/muconate lactonizing enzyme family protein [Sphingomonas sp. G-3-2-10]